ncbi:MAG: hypothetical protein B5766_01430 [Candidatus Lumbricidophila eiseniae]|uniref:Mutator family transposase n=1 Tax=Candidatus Lumbricidiphila eiseniae TaxID=1969409 RepID=A0A2A6FUF0_9MICO|nr:MAG: hypothetical protein B5766_01430 [Candidatus Lumbricidophila eiseniae]
MGVTTAGERDILGIWAGEGGEGARFWLSVLTELKNRGIEEVCIVVCDSLKGATGVDHYDVGARDRADLHHSPDLQHVQVRVTEVLGPDHPRPTAGLHSADRGYRESEVRGVREEVGEHVSRDLQALEERPERAHPVPGLRGPDPPHHLLNEHD